MSLYLEKVSNKEQTMYDGTEFCFSVIMAMAFVILAGQQVYLS